MRNAGHAEAHLRQLAATHDPVTPPRAALASLRKAMDLARIGATCSTDLVLRRRALLTAAARELTPRATAGVMRAAGLAVGHSGDLAERIRASGASAHALAARTIARALAALKRTMRFVLSVQAVGAVLVLVFTLCALQRTDGPQQLGSPPAPPPGPGLEPTRLEPARLESVRGLEPTPLEPAQAEPAQAAPSPPARFVEKDRLGRAAAD